MCLGWAVLKKRIIPLQLLKAGRLVKSINFTDYRDVGDPIKSSAVYSDQSADELIVLNLEPEQGIQPLLEIIEALAKVCYLPLTLGGGITNFQEAAQLIEMGADKVFVNSICYRNPNIVEAVVNTFGSQAVVAGIDYVWQEEKNSISLVSAGGSQTETVSLERHAKTLERIGVGEILLQSVTHDGKMQGFELSVLQDVLQCVDIPIIAAGGCGNYEHLKTLFEQTQVNGAVCGSLFNFSDSNPLRARSYLLNYGVPVKQI